MNAGEFVLVHGWGASRASWDALAPHLAGEGTVHMPDLPGHGQRRNIDLPASEVAWARDLAEQVRGGTWLGWSLGGQLALRVAIDHPGEIQRLVLIGAGATFVTRPGWPGGVEPRLLEAFREKVASSSEAAVQEFNAWQVAGARRARSTLAWLQQQTIQHPASRDGLLAGLQLLKDMDLRDQLPGLDIPVLVLVGSEDRVVSPGSTRQTAALLPNAHFEEIPGAGHAALYSHPQEICAAIEQFVQQEQAA
ncbi:MAG: alpha/beta fold hydrolase [Xanthomonadales bacterium]|nr:alpha/beta fold hydrolase [Xanthomonadales bacterium]